MILKKCSSKRIRKHRKKPCLKRLYWLNARTIKPYLKMPQDRAAQILSVSISTLKRRFYMLNLGRWPLVRRTPSEKFKKSKMSFITNKFDVEDERYIDEETFEYLFQLKAGGKKTNLKVYVLP